MKIRVSKQGVIQAVAPDDCRIFNRIGNCKVRRASHVEPILTEKGACWTVDLSPVGGPEFGPFSTRSEALQMERDWLEQRLGTLKFKESHET